MKRLLALILLGIMLLSLSSCKLIDKLGFDTYDYMSESVRETHGTVGEVADMLTRLLDILVADSPQLDTFSDMNGALTCYRDEVLTYMLKTEYAKFSGNTALIEKASAAYPQYQMTQVIPDSEFEANMYRYFGGSVKLTHKDTERFVYLDKVGVYISPVTPEDSGLDVRITYIGETDKTYRVRFYVEEDGTTLSDEYFALVIKRDDGTLYIKKLLLSSEVR